MTKTIHIVAIKRDPLVQCRVSLSEEQIASMKEAILSGHPTPPIVVFTEDNKTYYCADGHHRLAAHAAADQDVIEAQVMEGGIEAAFIYGFKANSDPRGLPMTRADKRKAVSMALERWGSTKSDREIAGLLGVSNTFVSDGRKARGDQSPALRSPVKNRPTVNVDSQIPKNHVPDPFSEDDELDYSSALESDGDVTITVAPTPAVVEVEASREDLDEIRLSLGRIIRAMDKIKDGKTYQARIRASLDLALKAIDDWKRTV